MVKYFLVALVCLCGCIPMQTHAQQAIGIDWDVPTEQSDAESELQSFSQLGVSHIQISQPLEDETWQLINELSFTVYGLMPVKFPTALLLTSSDSTYRHKIINTVKHYDKQDAVQAIGLFAYGNWASHSFQQAVIKFSRTLTPYTNKKTYYVSAREKSFPADSLFSFRLLSQTNVDTTINSDSNFLYQPPSAGQWNLKPVKQILNHARSIPNSVLFFNSNWLQEMMNKYPGLRSTLQLYSTSEDPAFPLPDNPERIDLSNNFVIIILLLAAIVLAITYNYNPVYRRSLLRYYSGHNFYVNDVMKRHVRSMFAGTTILLQHGIAGGVVLYCIFHSAFSMLGQQAFLHHYPILAVFGTTKLAIFFAGILYTLIIELLMVIWLWLAGGKSTYLSQIINLYPWSLQLNLVLAIITFGLYLANSNIIVLYLTGIIFVSIFVASFIITALDMGRHVSIKQQWFYGGTIGVYGLAFVSLLVWFLISQELQQAVQLALYLP